MGLYMLSQEFSIYLDEGGGGGGGGGYHSLIDSRSHEFSTKSLDCLEAVQLLIPKIILVFWPEMGVLSSVVLWSMAVS